MRQFPRYEKDEAPEAARPLLQAAEQDMGFIPNMFKHMAAAPPVLKAYMQLSELLGETGLSKAEQQLAMLTVSRANGCEFCLAAHRKLGAAAGLPEAQIEAVANGADTGDTRADALVALVAGLTEQRGWVDDELVERFVAAGFGREQVLECILVVATKTLSNYVNHVCQTDINEELQSG